jgi:hypothetical protein
MPDLEAKLVRAALEVIADPMNRDEEDMIEELVSRGIDHRTANRLIALVPLAFGRVLITHIARVGFSADFVAKTGERESVRPLKEEPIYVEARLVATAMFHEGPRKLFEPAATFSAELNAVNQALAHGDTLEGATLRPPVLTGFSEAGWT